MNSLSECCVCFECVGLYTNCGHNLCAGCYTKITAKICPLCRVSIKNLTMKKPKINKDKNKVIINNNLIEVEYITNNNIIGNKIINKNQLKTYIFSREFKLVLAYKITKPRRKDMFVFQESYIHDVILKSRRQLRYNILKIDEDFKNISIDLLFTYYNFFVGFKNSPHPSTGIFYNIMKNELLRRCKN